MEYNQAQLKEKAREIAKTKIESMTQEEISEIGNKEKKLQITLSCISLAIVLASILASVVCFMLIDSIFVSILPLVLFVPLFGAVVIKGFKDRNKDIKEWALSRMERELIAKPALIQKELEQKIIRVIILDSYTEVTDKLHAILNYQEIIQTRCYKFRVDYQNGNTDIITEKEGTERCAILLKLADNQMNINNEKFEDKTEELRKYKKLLDDKIITEEEFEKKKKQILDI